MQQKGDKDAKTYKSMNNALYVKTMENLRNRIHVKHVSNKKDYLKWTSKPSYISKKIFDNDLVAISNTTVTLTLNKLTYIGMCILDLSKVLMYEFYYVYIKNKYGNDSMLLFTDADSLMYEIKTEDIYEDFSKDRSIYSFTNFGKLSIFFSKFRIFSTNSKYYDDSNKLVVGKMENEAGSVDVKELVERKQKINRCIHSW